jgi:quinol-cytochrome oxidoreductase complex cytochrome b subunit
MEQPTQTESAGFADNARSLWKNFWRSMIRNGVPRSDRGRAESMVGNFFLHIQGVKVHKNTLRPTYTWGLGLITLFMLLILTVTGVILMVYYNPGIQNAYNTIKDLNFVVIPGKFMRNIHRWAAHAMVAVVILHMARVFYTGSYKKGREFNWIIGLGLLVMTFGLSLSGYMLPWDQLAYWALVIVANILQSPKEITDALGITQYFDPGGFFKELFLGGRVAGQESLTRVYLLHIIFLPILLFVLLGVHFWRIRKDGGLTKPESAAATMTGTDLDPIPSPQKKGGLFPTNKTYGLMGLMKGKTPAVERDVENTVMSWPHLLRAELAVFMLCMAVMMVLAYYFDAPLKEHANPLIPENPAKAPWYFLGLQELISYSAFMGGVGLPGIALLGLGLIPYLDREQDHVGLWFSNGTGKRVAVQTFFLSVIVVIGLLAFAINYGWIRNWWPEAPQLLITFINPGTIMVGILVIWSFIVLRQTGSTRMAAISLFTFFLVAFVILTYVGTELRGPNWDFYWSKSQWPIH